MSNLETSVEILKQVLINFNLNHEDLQSKTQEVLKCLEMIYTKVMELEARVVTISSTGRMQVLSTSKSLNGESKRFAPTLESINKIQSLSVNHSSEIDKIIEIEIERILDDTDFGSLPHSRQMEILRELTYELFAVRCSNPPEKCPLK